MKCYGYFLLFGVTWSVESICRYWKTTKSKGMAMNLNIPISEIITYLEVKSERKHPVLTPATATILWARMD